MNYNNYKMKNEIEIKTGLGIVERLKITKTIDSHKWTKEEFMKIDKQIRKAAKKEKKNNKGKRILYR